MVFNPDSRFINDLTIRWRFLVSIVNVRGQSEMSGSFFRKFASLNRAFMLVALASMLLAAMQIQAVKADPISINISPGSASVGDTITISGINATAYEEVRIFVLGFLFFAETVANETGGYIVDVTVPAVPFGTYPIMAVDVAEGDTAVTTLDIEPRIVLTPASGGFENEISIMGDGFRDLSDITILFDGSDITPFPAPQTNELGSFDSEFWVPSFPNGTYTVTVLDFWGNSASGNFTVVPLLRYAFPDASGAPFSLVAINGFGFGSSVNITVYFDTVNVSPYPWYSTGSDGSFQLPFFVPDVPDGTYMITANDTDGNAAHVHYVVPSPILALTPNRAFGSSLITARGVGFMPRAPVLLYLEDVAMTQLIDLMWMSPNLIVQVDGSFAYSFVVPVSAPGVYSVVAYYGFGSPSDFEWVTSAPLTIVDNSPIDIEVNVGAIHFRGEIAEFYAKTALDGELVNAKIDAARLYYSNGDTSLDITSTLEAIATGLFRIPYSIPSNASQGTYTLVAEAHYYADAVEAYGTGSCSFLISPTLTSANAQLIDINQQIGTVVIPDLGTIKVNLTAINARLVSIQGTEATIQTDIGSLKTTTDAINAKVMSIDGDVATVSSDLGTVKTHVTTTGFQLEAATLAVALVAAAGSILAFIFVRKLRTPSPTSHSNPGPPPAEPPEQVAGTQQTAVTDAVATLEPPTAVAPPVEDESSITLETKEAPDRLE